MNDHVTAHIVSPINDQLTVEVLAWSPGTDGTVTAPAFHLALPDRPTPSDLSAAGLPGINFEQDPIQYDAATHHTNLDTYERVIEADVRQSAVVIAATLYELAMRDELLPRFTKNTMPAGSWK